MLPDVLANVAAGVDANATWAQAWWLALIA
jgi:hypothetical protein